jgi:hypothetical protein
VDEFRKERTEILMDRLPIVEDGCVREVLSIQRDKSIASDAAEQLMLIPLQKRKVPRINALQGVARLESSEEVLLKEARLIVCDLNIVVLKAQGTSICEVKVHRNACVLGERNSW